MGDWDGRGWVLSWAVVATSHNERADIIGHRHPDQTISINAPPFIPELVSILYTAILLLL